MSEPSDIFWMLISIFYLPIDKQLQVIGTLPEKHFKEPYITRLYLFSCALNTYVSSWVDEFDFLYDGDAEKPLKIYVDFIEATNAITFKDCLMSKDYIHGRKWNLIRRISKEILLKSELPPIEVKEAVNFSECVRVFINDDGLIQQD